MSYVDETEREAAILNRRPVRGRVELLNDRLDALCRMIAQTEDHLFEVEHDPESFSAACATLGRLRRRLESTLVERAQILGDER